MKTTLTITERGVITLPAQFRKTLGISAADQLWADAYVFEEARRNLAAKTPGCFPVLNAMAGRIKIGGMSAGNSLLFENVITKDLAIGPRDLIRANGQM